jgi:hypothetical protein
MPMELLPHDTRTCTLMVWFCLPTFKFFFGFFFHTFNLKLFTPTFLDSVVSFLVALVAVYTWAAVAFDGSWWVVRDCAKVWRQIGWGGVHDVGIDENVQFLL